MKKLTRKVPQTSARKGRHSRKPKLDGTRKVKRAYTPKRKMTPEEIRDIKHRYFMKGEGIASIAKFLKRKVRTVTSLINKALGAQNSSTTYGGARSGHTVLQAA